MAVRFHQARSLSPFVFCVPLDFKSAFIKAYLSYLRHSMGGKHLAFCVQISKFDSSLSVIKGRYKAHFTLHSDHSEGLYVKDMPIYRCLYFRMVLIPKEVAKPPP